MAPSKEMALRSDTTVSKVNPDQTLKASKALLAHMKKAAKETAENAPKKDLLADDDDEAAAGEEPIWLTLTTKRHISDTRSLKPGKIALPHSLNTDPNLAVCLITAEPQRAFKNLVASDAFPADLRKQITRVIDYNKLKAKFKTFEAQRALFAEHDVFLGDSRIINRLPATLGKTFYKSTAKRPIPVTIHATRPSENGKRAPKQAKSDENPGNACTAPQLAAEISKALSSALVNLSPTTNTAVRVGLGSFTAEQVAANVDAVAGALVSKFVPGKWNNVRGLYVKGPTTAALPIWLTEELWVDADKDILADGSEEAKALEAAAAADKDSKRKSSSSSEKANIGKKRKASGDGDDEQSATTTTAAAKKSKKSEVEGKLLPEVKTGGKGKGKGKISGGSGAAATDSKAASDDKLDKEIAERKAALKKQKKAAKKAVDV
ncbi:ribosomal protein L1p/L10e family-domain-containing protein [Microdochium trichocladiopsis]|uniref:Ribosomal protein L1p/L10e family-domain-containing protein n=1 Tax=Microdochium trichocladiopsis TaxID=1682393 RepID=A0A9P8Y9R6_9PEZI|nr:ribosomal protein L1p/L10e family-domain-containing protein [Microdochium trichocladiopsis]KAH7031379.1 ribosomal protein L1p/L10e family-domain-containing protein [Microdochium trichocladiopsis]